MGLSEKLTKEKLNDKYTTYFGWPLLREFMRAFLFSYSMRGWRIKHLEKELYGSNR